MKKEILKNVACAAMLVAVLGSAAIGSANPAKAQTRTIKQADWHEKIVARQARWKQRIKQMRKHRLARLEALKAKRGNHTGNAKKAIKTVKKSPPAKRVASIGPKRSNYDTLIARYASAEGIPLRLAHAVVRVESNYKANARGSVGEIGLMQLRPATARMMDFRGSIKNLYHPETNLKYGMRYLGKAHRLAGGSVCGTILKYNAGHGAKRMNPISARYCRRVRKML